MLCAIFLLQSSRLERGWLEETLEGFSRLESTLDCVISNFFGYKLLCGPLEALEPNCF